MGQPNQSEFNSTEFNETGSTPVPVGSPLNRVFVDSSAPVGPTSYGALRLRLAKALPGIDTALINGWISDRYQYILDRLPWQRLEKSAAIQTFAPLQLGTVTATSGSTAISAIGANWTQSITGTAIRIDNGNEYYEFTPSGAESGNLDRPYEGTSGAGLAYIIFATVYQLPADCRELRAVRLLADGRSLHRFGKEEMDYVAGTRAVLGKPQGFSPYMDDASTPPRMQIEIYPAPDCVMGLGLDYIAEEVTPGGSSIALLPWMRPAALYHGVRADGLDQMRDYTGADRANLHFMDLLQSMVNLENRNTAPVQLKMASRFVRHRLERVLRSLPNNRGRCL